MVKYIYLKRGVVWLDLWFHNWKTNLIIMAMLCPLDNVSYAKKEKQGCDGLNFNADQIENIFYNTNKVCQLRAKAVL